MKFEKNDLRSWLQQAKTILSEMETFSKEDKNQITEILQKLKDKIAKASSRLYLIVNEGVHPIIENLKKQFGEESYSGI